MAAAMSQPSLKEYIERVRERYGRMKGKQARSRLLDEFCCISGLERKYAIKVLRGHRRQSTKREARGRRSRYGPELVDALKRYWFAMEQPCGKRMASMLRLWVAYDIGLAAELRHALCSVSAASIDRLLKEVKTGSPKRKPRVPRSDPAIKELVAIRAESWKREEVGFTEVDTVAHCGGDMSGSFIWSLTSIEIYSGWTEVRCVWNRGRYATLEGLHCIEEAQPFTLKGIDSDGGGEFVNYHLYTYLKERGVIQTRSRPYFKNDQAYVEQKNWTHVRSLLGYERLEHEELLEPLNEALAKWSLWNNLFCTNMEQTSAIREGSKIRRKYAANPLTPAQRLLGSGQLSWEEQERIEGLLAGNNPFELRETIEKELASIWRLKEKLDLAELERRGWALACEGFSPLRSEKPSQAKKTPNLKTATVS